MSRCSTPFGTRARVPLMAILASVALASSACGVIVAEPTTAPPQRELSEENHLEYGASLDEFLDADSDGPASSTPPDGFQEIQWDDLIPAGFSGEEISARFDDRIAAVEPGTPEANEVFAELQAEYDNQPINPELAGNSVQLAGFVAPLTYDGDLITEFLLVPYFGACIHVPPPPVNQTVIVTLEEGQSLTIDESWGAVWVTGTLAVDGAETDIATAGYSITGAQTGVYNDY